MKNHIDNESLIWLGVQIVVFYFVLAGLFAMFSCVGGGL